MVDRNEIRTMQKDLARLQGDLPPRPQGAAEDLSEPEETIAYPTLRAGLRPEERILGTETIRKPPPPGHEDVLFPELHTLSRAQEAIEKGTPREAPPALEKVLEMKEKPLTAPPKTEPSPTLSPPPAAPPLPRKETAPKKETPALEQILEEGEEDGQKERRAGKLLQPRVMLASAALLLVLLLGGGSWWFFLRKPQPPLPLPPPPPSPEVEIKTPPLPAPLLLVEETRTVPIAEITQGTSAIRQALGRPQPENRVTRFVVLLQQEPQRYFSASELANAAGLSLSETALQQLQPERAMIFVVPEQEGVIRIGFAAQAKNRDLLLAALSEQEPQMEQALSDFLDLIKKTGQASTTAFQDNTYLGRHIRYLNFPTPVTTIDYTVDEKTSTFLLTTSRTSMYTAIDRLSE